MDRLNVSQLVWFLNESFTKKTSGKSKDDIVKDTLNISVEEFQSRMKEFFDRKGYGKGLRYATGGIEVFFYPNIHNGIFRFCYNQYITKFKDQKKNIIQPEIISFLGLYSKSLEEFGLQNQFGTDFIKLYYIITKDSKQKYRVSLDSFKNESRVLRFSSTKSFIKTISF